MRSWTILVVAALLAWSPAALADGADGGEAAPIEAMPVDDGSLAGSPAIDTGAASPADALGEPMDDAGSAEPASAPALDEGLAFDEDPASSARGASDADPALDEAMGMGLDAEPTDAEGPSANAGTSPAPATTERYARIANLGPEAIDEHGHRGRIHTVAKGDTLWDISNAYLGTPWVWPSVWEDNGEIENPHLILPGDHIWVTAGEMRKVTADQAEAMIAADNETDSLVEPGPAELAVDDEPEIEPAADIEDESDLMADDVPAALDELPVAVPLEPSRTAETGRTVHVAEREVMGFVTSDAIEAATSIVDSPSPRTWLVEGDMIYLGMGEGRVEVGDEFTIFRDEEPVHDVGGGRVLGYHVDVLGWAVVREIDGESAIAEIRMSHSEAERGDRVIPRKVVPPAVPVRSTPDGVAGNIVFMPNSRTSMGTGDYVYLNRGALHGFEVGSEVEVYIPGRLKKEPVSGDKVMTPDRVDARLVLVEVTADTAVAYVVTARRELEIGDRVRAAPARVARR